MCDSKMALHHEEILIWHDGPMLFVGRNREGIPFLLSSIEELEDESKYIGIQLRPGDLHRLKSGEVDLRSFYMREEAVLCIYTLYHAAERSVIEWYSGDVREEHLAEEGCYLDTCFGDKFKTEKYVRCRFCDSGITYDNEAILHSHLRELPQVEGVAHDRVEYICPACGLTTESFAFHYD